MRTEINYKRKIIFVALLPVFLLLTALQGDSVLLFSGVSGFDVDVMGNVFVNKDNVLIKYDSKGSKTATYTNYTFGDIRSFEAGDALNFMVFYDEPGEIVFLDNNLAVKRSPISLTDLGYPRVSQACVSYNTGFWIFDNISEELVRFDRLLVKSQSTGNLVQLTGYQIRPFLLRESGDYVFAADSTEGIFVFDRYGAFLRRIPLKGFSEFQLISQKLSVLKNDTIFSFDMKTTAADTVPLPFKNLVKFKYSSRNFYYQTAGGEIFKRAL